MQDCYIIYEIEVSIDVPKWTGKALIFMAFMALVTLYIYRKCLKEWSSCYLQRNRLECPRRNWTTNVSMTLLKKVYREQCFGSWQSILLTRRWMHASAGRGLDPKGEYRASKSILGSYFDSLSNCVINITPYVINWNSTAIK